MTTLPMPTGLLIDGEWIAGSGTLPVVDPSDLSVIAEVGDAGVDDGLAAVTAAHDAFRTWSATPARQRAELLRRAFEIMSAEAQECARRGHRQ